MEGLIFGGDHIEREICVTKSIGLAYSWKEICFVVLFLLCFISHLRAISNCKPRTGDLMEGFFCFTSFRGLYLEGLIHGGAYFRNFMVFAFSVRQCEQKREYLYCQLFLFCFKIDKCVSEKVLFTFVRLLFKGKNQQDYHGIINFVIYFNQLTLNSNNNNSFSLKK